MTMNTQLMHGTYKVHEATNAATRYVLRSVDLDSGETLVCAETDWGGHHGEWILLGEHSVAWSYIAEKMPRLARLDGDKPGWIKAFAAAGIRVFG